MLQEGERETEILLGNKQLLVIFFVGAALLGAAFTGGYMLGRKSGVKPAAETATQATDQTAAMASQQQPPSGGGPGGETHSVSPADETASVGDGSEAGEPLGSRKKRSPAMQAQPVKVADRAAPRQDTFSPETGQEFLQVMAVPRQHAVAVATVLRRKGFRAHAVPKPGDRNMYRVLVGPIRDAGELSSTRDSLRKTGFNQVLVQHYQ